MNRLAAFGLLFIAILGLSTAPKAAPLAEATPAADSTSSPGGATGWIYGVVTGADDGAPLNPAYVTVVGPGGVRRLTSTDAEGRYQLEAPAGRYDVEFSYMFFPVRKLAGVDVAPGRKRLDMSLSRRAEVEFGGHVVNAVDGLPIPDANIAFRPTDGATGLFGAVTGPDGRFRIKVPTGSYEVTALYFMFDRKTLPGVTVREGYNSALRVEMTPQNHETREIVVRGNRITDTKVADVQSRRKAAAISDGITRDTISKSSDSDAGQVMRRVTGLSVKDGRYLIVRGLSERYATTSLNGVRVASPEPNRKIIPLDIFPSGLLDQITIQKAYTPDQPGEFGGGSVLIRTRDIPENPVWAQSLAFGILPQTTGSPGLAFRQGRLDFLGVDDGHRNLPELIRNLAGHAKIVQKSPLRPNDPGYTKDEIIAFGRSFNDEWTPHEEKGPLAGSSSFTAGRRFELFGRPAGLIGGMTYASSAVNSDGDLNFYQDASLAPKATYREQKTTRSVLWGGTGTATYRLGEGSSFKAGLFYSRNSDDEARRYEGMNYDRDRPLRAERSLYVQRYLVAGTLGGEHPLPFLGARVEWKLNRSRATRDEPDRRENSYEQVDSGSPDAPDPAWRYFNSSLLFSGVDDNERGFDGKIAIPFHSWAAGDARVQFGVQRQSKSRSSWTRWFGFDLRGADPNLPVEQLLSDANIGNGVNFTEMTRGTDYYWADQKLDAGFGLVDLPILPRLRMLTGLRVERARQWISTYSGAVFTSPLERYGNDDTDRLPALNLTYALTDKSNLRFAASQTVGRPDLRELTDFDLFNYVGSYNETGNPDLKRSLIRAADLRWETFPGPAEVAAASVFYKDLVDPIERAVQGGDQPRYFPLNGEGGVDYGLELESRKGLGFLGGRFRNWSASANLTLIHSEAKIPKTGTQTSTQRPLEGQSKFVMNVGLFYTSPGGRSEASVLYNAYGRRLTGVGIFGQPDIYERAQTGLDATLTHALTGRLRLKGAAKNLTNGKRITEQGGKVRTLFSPGTSFSLALGFGS